MKRHELFEKTGVLYSGIAANHTNALCTAFLEDPRTHISNKIAGIIDIEELRKEGTKARIVIEEEISSKLPEVILFSAEGMANLSAPELKKFNDWAKTLADEISVCYVVRNPVNYCASVMQQHLKGGDILESMYENPPLQNCKGRIGNAIQAFGRKNTHVYTFEEMTSYSQGIVEYFLNKIAAVKGSMASTILLEETKANESLSHEAALILSSLNRQRPMFVDGKHGTRRTMRELQAIELIRGEKFHLPAVVSEKIARLSEPDNIWLSDVFGITSYINITNNTSAPLRGLSSESIDSIAILLSNLMNGRYVIELLRRAEHMDANNEKDELSSIASELLRVAPEIKLPPLLSTLKEIN
ncbi:hypothetical protein ERD78_06140 [Allopusillimonas soli]|uniref:Sulfotransferase domain-containing protein n=1 Tax=Allopusillimonas soli TaxID=659016 RepID=A0A853F8Z1_9BURK|nr:hypothetical protein [Allopusillimonas soli]NYT36447.1 hypothetical protein [Allopusillimonas soli]TEA74956.1 hypothetical protein ERD78_06140 [Allopusillimonas soli]